MASDQVNLGSVFMDLRVNTSNIGRDMATAKTQVESQLSGLQKSVSGTTAVTSKLGGTFATLGKGLLSGFGIGAGLLGIQSATQALVSTFSNAVGGAIRFESAMANINTVLGASKPNLAAFADGIKEISKNSPTDVDELGAAAYDIVSAGITDTAKALDVLQASQKLAVAGLGSTKQAVDIMTSAINAYGISADQAGAISNVFYNAVNFGKTTVEGLAQGFGGMVPIAAQAGITFEEVGAAVGSLTASGKSASEVYTGLEAAASALLKPNEDMIKVFDKLGAQTGLDLVKKFGGLKGAYEQIVKTSKELGLSVAEVTGRKEAQSTVTALLTTASKAYDEQLQNNLNGLNTIDQAYQTQLETTENVYKRYKNQINVILITLGAKILPLLVKAMGFVMDAFSSLYQHGRIIANGFTFVAKGVAAVVAALTSGVKAMLKNGLNSAIGFVNSILGTLNKLGSKVLEKLGFDAIPNSIQIPEIKFDTSGDQEITNLMGVLSELAKSASQDIDDVGDAASKIGQKKALAGIEGLGEAFGKIGQQVAEVDPEFERAKKGGDEAKKAGQEALKTFGDLSKALQDFVQDRLRFYATEEQNNRRLEDILADNKLSVQDLSTAWKEAMSTVNKQMTDLHDNHKKVGETLEELTGLAKSYGDTSINSNRGVFASYEALNKALEVTKTKINDILSQLKQIDDQTKSSNESFEKEVVKTIVDAEQRMKELKADLSKERSEEDPNSDRIQAIQAEMAEQKKILDYARKEQLGSEEELAVERKKRSLNRLELLQFEHETEMKQLAERKTALQAELAEQLVIVEGARQNEQMLYQSMQQGIIEMEQNLSRIYQANLNERIAATTAFVNKAEAEYQRLAQIVAKANSLQSSLLGLPKSSSQPIVSTSVQPSKSSSSSSGQQNNIQINAQVNNQTDWSQVGQQMAWQLRGAQ